MQDSRRFLMISVLAGFAILVLFASEFPQEGLPILALQLLILVVIVALALGGAVRKRDENRPQSVPSRVSRREFLESLSKSLSVPFMIISSSGRVVFISETLQSEFPWMTANEHYSKMARASSFVDAVRAGLDGREVEPFLFETHRVTDRVFEARMTQLQGEPFRGMQGKLLVEVLNRTKERRADVMRRDFIANASHELRTPLASILGGLETMQAAHDLETMDHFLPIMSKEAARMQRLIADLMSLSKVEMNEHFPPKSEVNLGQVLEQSLDALKTRGALEDVKIDNQFESDVVVMGDPDQLQQVITNILDNAIKYGGEPACVTISRHADDARYPRKVGLSIADNGHGIAPQDVPRLTERFYRVSKSESQNKGGTGLGLAIVKHIMRRHQGDLQIDSQLGEGSVFTIWLNESI